MAAAEEAVPQRSKALLYPLDAKSYRLLHEIGSGVSAVVYKASCLALSSSVVAIKSIDLEHSRANLDDVRREAKAMALLSHPNILRAHCSFTVGSRLWVVMPFMAAGSLHSIISSSFPDGLPEPSIAAVLRDTLLALSYLHAQGLIHRDIKAGNILVDSDGSIRLADFGVSASIYDSLTSSSYSSSSWWGSSFCNDMAGTPYWMAPEVIHSHVGYGIKADIWSFGITALELAHGRPPLSHLPLSKSLMMRITNRLRLEDAHHFCDKSKKKKKKKKFSKAFKDMVASCLAQDPSKRPSAEKLLKHPFFKGCRSPDYIVKNVLQAVPPVEERFKESRVAVDDVHISSTSSSPENMTTKTRRISGWNFNEDAFKMDPVYPTDTNGAFAKSVRFAGEEDDEELPSPVEVGSEGGKDVTDGDGDHGEGEGLPETPVGVLPKELLVPNLVSLLTSLDVQRGMVMNVLTYCGGGGGGGDDDDTTREQQLLGFVERLQNTVDDLSIQLQREKRRNACLEQELDCLREKSVGQQPRNPN